MNNTKTQNIESETEEVSVATAAVNYILNRFAPFAVILFLLFYYQGFATWQPYAIFGMVLFVSRFSFLCGYANAKTEEELEQDD